MSLIKMMPSLLSLPPALRRFIIAYFSRHVAEFAMLLFFYRMMAIFFAMKLLLLDY